MYIDVHRHYSYDKTDIERLPQYLDSAKIAKTVLFGYNGYGKPQQDQDVIAAYKQHPDRVIPFLCGIDFADSLAPEYVERCLERENYMGIGEILIGSWNQARYFSGITFDGDIPVEIFKIAGRHGIPVLFRCDRFRQNEIMNMLRLCRETNFIWAHAACDYAKRSKTQLVEADYLRYMLIMHPNLHFELSMPTKLLPGLQNYKYSEVFLDYPDKFMFGTDITGTYRDSQNEIMPEYDALFETIPEEVREKIKSENFLKLIPKGKLANA